ncbi:MAG: CBS domain-containing protein [bacterium]
MNEQKLIRARDVMLTDFIVMDGLSTVQQAVTTLKQNDAHTVIVQRRNEDDEFGIVVLSDIAKKILAKDRAPERVNLYEVMSKPAIGVDCDMDIRYVARMFDQFGLATCPVYENREVIGVITYNELVLHRL